MTRTLAPRLRRRRGRRPGRPARWRLPRALLRALTRALPGALLATAAWLPVAAGQNREPTGREIIDAMIARHDRPVERRQVRLLRIDARGAATAGSLEWIRGRTGDGRPGYLWRLTAPADAARTAVLGWARAGAADDQWLYRPDTGSIQTIIAGARRHAIPGGGFSFEDLEPEDRAGHRYDRRPDAMLGGALLFVVEATATAPDLARSTAYAFRRLYITRDTVFPVQVEYVDRRTRQPAKTLFVQAPTAIGRSAWRARLSVLEDYRRGTRTEWRVDRWDFRPSAVPADLFDPAALKQDRHRP